MDSRDEDAERGSFGDAPGINALTLAVLSMVLGVVFQMSLEGEDIRWFLAVTGLVWLAPPAFVLLGLAGTLWGSLVWLRAPRGERPRAAAVAAVLGLLLMLRYVAWYTPSGRLLLPH